VKIQEAVTSTQPDEGMVDKDVLDYMKHNLTPYQRKMIGRATLVLDKRKSLHKLDLKHFMLESGDA
jgi:hypothetical protein